LSKLVKVLLADGNSEQFSVEDDFTLDYSEGERFFRFPTAGGGLYIFPVILITGIRIEDQPQRVG